MKTPHAARSRSRTTRTIAASVSALGIVAVAGAFQALGASHVATPTEASATGRTTKHAPACEAGNGGITLPPGFCATVFADKLGAARHPVAVPSGDVYIAMQPRTTGAAATAGVAVLRDTDNDGKADKQEYFGPYGGGGIAIQGNHLYLDARAVILRYTLKRGEMVPTTPPDTIVTGLPANGGHSSRELALDGKGNLYVNVGSATNVCQPGRDGKAMGIDPCVELETRAGIWKFSDSQLGQKFTPGARYVTGLRNAVGLAWNPKDNSLYSTQHGRDSFVQSFPQFYDQKKSAENPAEEFMKLQPGDDFGWPYCYYDNDLKRLVLAPEYGGDAKMPGRCTSKKLPLVAFPGHWAPNALEFYSGNQFPAKYRDGAFIAFHGSWNRAPEPQAGYRVVFVPAKQNKFEGTYETFADGFAGLGDADRTQGAYRPMGLTTMPDGSMLITDDKVGRVWKVMYQK